MKKDINQEKQLNLNQKPSFSSPKNKFNFWKVGCFILTFFCFISILFLVNCSQDKKRLLLKTNKIEEEIKSYEEKKINQSIYVNSWKEFNDSDYSFSFKYPSNWIIEKKCFENFDSCVVEVTNYPNNCKDCTTEELFQYRYFKIESLGKNNYSKQYMGALEYLLTDWLDFLKEEKERNLPTIPGFARFYKADANYFFNSDFVDAIEVNVLGGGGKGYLLMTNSNNIYVVKLIGSIYENCKVFDFEKAKDPTIEMLKDLKIENNPIVVNN